MSTTATGPARLPSSEAAEEMAIALAILHSGNEDTLVVSDAKTAVRNFTKGWVSVEAAHMLNARVADHHQISQVVPCACGRAWQRTKTRPPVEPQQARPPRRETANPPRRGRKGHRCARHRRWRGTQGWRTFFCDDDNRPRSLTGLQGHHGHVPRDLQPLQENATPQAAREVSGV